MSAHRAPGPPGAPLLGHLLPFRRDVLGLLTASRARHGDVVRFRLGPLTLHLVAHPDAIRHVLQERADLYDKETRSSAKIRGLTGRGLLTASGAFWHRQRRLLQPGFRPQAVAGFVPRMAEAAEEMLERWQERAGAPLDAASEMMRLTYTVVGRTLFSTDVSGDADAVEDAMAVLLAHTYRRLERIVDLPLAVPTPGNLRFRRALATIDRVVYRILAERRASGATRDDLLSLLLAARDEESGEGMGDRQLRNETLTLLLAGHETTANALAWTFHLLARHPEAAERIAAEAAPLDGRVPTAADLAGLAFTERVLREALRLYPPIWALERRASAADAVAGYRIPAGSTVVVSPWVTHRHPDFWEEPERFDPDRFTPERSAGRPPLAFVPFGAGPRFCIGAHFALTEMLLITARVVQRFRLRPAPGRPAAVPHPGITLRARDGVWIALEARR